MRLFRRRVFWRDGWVNSEAGSILFAFIAILVSIAMLWRSDRKHAAVGRRYVQSAKKRFEIGK